MLENYYRENQDSGKIPAGDEYLWTEIFDIFLILSFISSSGLATMAPNKNITTQAIKHPLNELTLNY